MINSKLYRAFSVLKNEELKPLEKWIYSQFMHKEEDTIHFFHFLCKQKDETDAQKWEKEYIFKKLFRKESYNDAKMRKLMFLLLKEIERYICFTASQEPIFYHTQLAEFYRTRYVQSGFREHVQDLSQQIDRINLRNANYFEQKGKIDRYNSYLHLLQSPGQINHALLDQLRDEQIAFFASQLQLYFSVLGNSIVYKWDFSKVFLLQLLELLESDTKYLELGVIRSYYFANKLLLCESTENPYFDLLKTELAQSEGFLTIDERTSLAVVLRNYANSRISRGEQKYKAIRFQLFLEHAEMGLLNSNNYLAFSAYINVIRLGLSLEKVAEVESFAAKYERQLPPLLSEIVLSYTKTFIAFHKKEYRLGLRLLQNVESIDDEKWEVDIRILRCKLLYHLEEIELVIANLLSLKVYLSRQSKLTETHKNGARLFVNFALQLCSLPQKPQTQEKLRLKIEASICLEKEWLLSLL